MSKSGRSGHDPGGGAWIEQPVEPLATGSTRGPLPRVPTHKALDAKSQDGARCQAVSTGNTRSRLPQGLDSRVGDTIEMVLGDGASRAPKGRRDPRRLEARQTARSSWARQADCGAPNTAGPARPRPARGPTCGFTFRPSSAVIIAYGGALPLINSLRRRAGPGGRPARHSRCCTSPVPPPRPDPADASRAEALGHRWHRRAGRPPRVAIAGLIPASPSPPPARRSRSGPPWVFRRRCSRRSPRLVLLPDPRRDPHDASNPGR